MLLLEVYVACSIVHLFITYERLEEKQRLSYFGKYFYNYFAFKQKTIKTNDDTIIVVIGIT